MRLLFSKRFDFPCEISSRLTNTFTNKTPAFRPPPLPHETTTKVKPRDYMKQFPRKTSKLSTFVW